MVIDLRLVFSIEINHRQGEDLSFGRQPAIPPEAVGSQSFPNFNELW
jgi:hypothetical protein